MRGRGVALASLLLALGCKEQSERKPAVCVGRCGGTPGLGTGVSPEGGAGPTGEGGSAGESAAIDLTGSVLVLTDELTFLTGDTFNGEASLVTQDRTGRKVTGLWNGVDDFAIHDVQKTSLLWLLVDPKNPVADDAVPVLEAVRTDRPDAMGDVTTTLAVLRATTVEHLFDLSSVPITPDSGKAQIVLLIKDKKSSSANPPAVSGVTVSAPSAENTLYGATGSFSDVVTVTDDTGVAVLLNVPGAAWPGALVSLSFSGSRTGGSTVPAVNGAVTLATLML